MIPKVIQPHFKITQQTKNRDSILIKGKLTCCNSYDFEVFAVGKIKHSLFSKMFLYPENDEILFDVRCKNCGKIISVFDSNFDGYGRHRQHGQKKKRCISNRLFNCVKCHNESFCVTIGYEYSDIQELQELETSDIDNAFTWIWITLECSKCGTRYKNFVDYETT